MIGVLRGGPFGGERHEVSGARLVFPLSTVAYRGEHAAWFEEYGLAWTIENLDHLWENPTTPRPPPFPEAVYDWHLVDVERVGVFRD